jgi:hypothetical protein
MLRQKRQCVMGRSISQDRAERRFYILDQARLMGIDLTDLDGVTPDEEWSDLIRKMWGKSHG